MYPVHESDSGSFQELAHASDVEFGQLSILTIEPGCERGGHYHRRKKEWFCCTRGSCWLATRSIKTGRQADASIVTLHEGNKQFVEVHPFEVHTIRNPGASVCELLIIANEEFDPEDADTYRKDGYNAQT
jgi:UDP-2-acetamido-2,6-beta-L-arabino-hexul-4-ose reductase